MKLLRFEKSASPLLWRKLYSEDPHLAHRPYSEQLARYRDQCAYYAGAMEHYMAPLGYDVMEVYTDIQPLQRAWARENGVRWNGATWMKSIPLEQARHFKPDVVYSYDSRNLDFAFLARMRAECASVRIVTGFIASPSFDVETFRQYDFLITCTQEYQDLFTRAGIRTELLTHVFDARVLSLLSGERRPHRDVVFSGAIWRHANGHSLREEVLERIVDLAGFELYTPQASVAPIRDWAETTLRRAVYSIQRALGSIGVPHSTRRRLPLIGRAATWTAWPIRQLNPGLQRVARAPVFGLDMLQLLRDARVTLNCVAFREAANMRLFEATGVGTCLLTDHRDNLCRLFEVDSEIVTYRSAEECVDKAKWLLEHTEAREKIAAAGQRRTLRDHTYAHRAQALDSLIRETLRRHR